MKMAVVPGQTLTYLRAREANRVAQWERRRQRLRERLDAAASLLSERFGVVDARVFGSLVTGDTSGECDADLAVRGLDPRRYFEALAVLMELFDGPVDLVRIEEASMSLRRRIEEEGERL